MQNQWRRAAVAAASLLATAVAVCFFLPKASSPDGGSTSSSLLQIFTMGLSKAGGKYADRLYGEQLAVEEDLARINALRGSLLLPSASSHDGRLKANLGIGERRLPDAFLLNGQQLAGWRAEQSQLRSLEQKAEERLKKDLAAADNRGKAGDDVVQGYNATGGRIKLIKDDDGEEVPEGTLKAEAAALGFATVQEWQRAVAGHALEASPSTQKARPVHKAETAQHETPRFAVAQQGNDGINGFTKWISSIFAAKGSQQLYSTGSITPGKPDSSSSSSITATTKEAAPSWEPSLVRGANTIIKPEMLGQAVRSRDASARPPIGSGVLALGTPADGVETFALVPV